MDEKLKKDFKELWNLIADFEERELQSWKNTNELHNEARISARMEAYVKLTEKLVFND